MTHEDHGGGYWGHIELRRHVINATDTSADVDAARRLTAGGLVNCPDDVLEVLLEAIREELARRDIAALADALRACLAPDTSEPEIRELVAEHGPAQSVLFVAEEWYTGHLLGTDADVTFADGQVENVDLRRLQPYVMAVSAVHAPVGYAAEYRVDLRTGEGRFAPIGFGDPIYPPGMREIA